MFKNFYSCPQCGTKWEDEWSCACNDRCPKCNAEIEPYESEDLGGSPPVTVSDELMSEIKQINVSLSKIATAITSIARFG